LQLPIEGTLGPISPGGGGYPDIAAVRRLLKSAITQSAEAFKALWGEMAGPLDRTAHLAQSGTAAVRVLRDVHPQMLYVRAFDCVVSAVG
jgi:hypothetical protein